MPTPVGHSLAGLSLYLALGSRPSREDRAARIGVTVGAALGPDLDFVLGPLLGRNVHQHFTHSLAFVALCYFAAIALARATGRRSPPRDAGLVAAAYLSHVLLDTLSKDTSAPFGVQLLWPFSDTFFRAPLILFDDIWRGRVELLFGLHNWLAVAREILILGPLAAFFWWRRRP